MSDPVQKSPGFEKHPDYMVHIEKSPRQIKVEIGGETIAKSINAILVRESNHLPVYYFPREDVRTELLTPTDQNTFCPFKGEASYWSIAVGGRSLVDAVWSYEAPFDEVIGLKDFMAFYWNKMDHWYEEDEEIYVHARDPYKRVDAIKSSRNVKVELGGEIVAESTNATFVFETGMQTRYYLPMDDVRMEILKRSDTLTRCPYKGQAHYWSATVAGNVFDDIVWSYPNPVPEAPKLRNLLSFYNENVDAIYIDGELIPKTATKWSK